MHGDAGTGGGGPTNWKLVWLVVLGYLVISVLIISTLVHFGIIEG